MTQLQVLKEAIRRFGSINQKEMAIEECSELIDALCKEKRGRNTDDDVITEIADVSVMCMQLAIMYGEDAVEREIARKINRLKERMNL